MIRDDERCKSGDRWGTRGAAGGNFESSFIGGAEMLLKEVVMLVL